MVLEFTIKDYFEKDRDGLSYQDVNKISDLRNKLNSFKTIGEQIKYIKHRRSNNVNKTFDQRVFGISKDAKIDPKLDRELNYDNKNEHWNGQEVEDNKEDLDKNRPNQNFLERHNFQKVADKIKFITKNSTIILWISFILIIAFLILNITLFVLGVVNSAGSSPFQICSGGSAVGSTSGDGSKVKNGYKIPVDYVKAGSNYTGQNYTGSDDDRGIGVFASEDFAFPGTNNFSEDNYAVSSRWEYCSYSIKKGMWPGHASGGNKTSDGVNTSMPFTNLSNPQYSWIIKQKVLITNPKNGKGVVCIIGNGVDDANWGGSPLDTVGGLSYKAQGALGFSAGTIKGGDYNTNCRDSGISLDMSWAPDDAVVGPCQGKIVVSNNCTTESVETNNSSIADAAVSFAYETSAIGTPNSSLNNGNGTDLYVKVHDKVLAGDPWYQSCDRSGSTAIRWSGADDNFPAGGCTEQVAYAQRTTDKWKEIQAKSQADLQPGDLIIAPYHTIIFAGNAAVAKKFPNSKGVLVSGSIGGASSPEQQSSCGNNRPPCVGDWYSMGLVGSGGNFHVFRNIKKETSSKYSSLKF